jgi:APA family basic amino acid/polyamine antiporter
VPLLSWIVSLTGIAAAENAGPAVTLSFILAAVGCAFAGLCYAEFASMIPVAGVPTRTSYATMGEFVAWIIGWDLVLEYALGAATVAVSWSQYVDKFLANYGIHIPQSILHGPWDTKPGIINLPSILIFVYFSVNERHKRICILK